MTSTRLFTCAGLLLILFATESAQAQTTLPDFSSAVFTDSTTINNPFFPLVPGAVSTFHAQDFDPDTGEATAQLIIVEVLNETRTVAGVEARIVRDRVFQDKLIQEDTFDWYAQDTAGNVWYLGEDVTDYHYDDAGNLLGTSHPGMWETGVDGALPGHVMPANPRVGDQYYQEYYPGTAEDEARVAGLGESFVVPLRRFENTVLRTRDITALEPGSYANKFYAPGVGPIGDRAFTDDGSALLAAVDRNPTAILPAFDAANFASDTPIDNAYFPVVAGRVYNYAGEEFDEVTGETQELGFQETHTSRTREILGVTTQIVRGFEFHDGLLFEDSDFYYAQDKDGNVWWMGETSTKFEYDELGNLIGTFDDSTWIAGENGAKPGYYMPKELVIGSSAYEIFSPHDGDLDHADIVSTTESLSTVLGDLGDVAIVLEASDFSPGFYAHKYYAPGLGLMLVEEDFDAFGNPRVVLELTSMVPEPATGCLFAVGAITALAGVLWKKHAASQHELQSSRNQQG